MSHSPRRDAKLRAWAAAPRTLSVRVVHRRCHEQGPPRVFARSPCLLRTPGSFSRCLLCECIPRARDRRLLFHHAVRHRAVPPPCPEPEGCRSGCRLPDAHPRWNSSADAARRAVLDHRTSPRLEASALDCSERLGLQRAPRGHRRDPSATLTPPRVRTEPAREPRWFTPLFPESHSIVSVDGDTPCAVIISCTRSQPVTQFSTQLLV